MLSVVIVVFGVLTLANQTKTDNTHNNSTTNCVCGKFEKITKSIDGFQYSSGDFPWLIGLFEKKYKNAERSEPFCLGTIISDRHILTSASCVLKKTPHEVFAFLFGSNVTMRRKRTIEKILIHNEYNRTVHNNNLAILALALPLKLDPVHFNVVPICLPNKKIDLNYLLEAEAVMTQFQYSRSVFSMSSLYYFGSVSVHLARLGNADCDNIFTERTNSEICWDNEKSQCYGKHGSILAIPVFSKKYFAIGVYSKGYGCKGYIEEVKPADVSTDISKHIDWLMDNTLDGKFCKQ